MPGWRILFGTFVVCLLLATGALPVAQAQSYPTYAVGDLWEYAVEARVDSLVGVGNVSGFLVASGNAVAEVTSVAGGEATLSWSGDLALQGNVRFPGSTVGATVSGTIETGYEERRLEPYFLPIGFDTETTFDVTVTLFVPVPYLASIVLNATLPPTTSSPTYPLRAENRTFGTTGTLETEISVDFPGIGFQNASIEEVASTIQWTVAQSMTVTVPAGTFSGSRVQMEAIAGFIPSPFQALIPGAIQVTHHSDEVGSPVLFEFLVNGTEVGRAELEAFSLGSPPPPPFWQNPFLIGGLLAIPIALLLYRYLRERRRGL